MNDTPLEIIKGSGALLLCRCFVLLCQKSQNEKQLAAYRGAGGVIPPFSFECKGHVSHKYIWITHLRVRDGHKKHGNGDKKHDQPSERTIVYLCFSPEAHAPMLCRGRNEVWGTLLSCGIPYCIPFPVTITF